MTDKPKSTPGPWLAEGPDMFGAWNILSEVDALDVAAVVPNERPAEEVEANALIIAAAPDLHEALQNMMGIFDNAVERRRHVGKDGLYEEAIAIGRAAIAKAEGRP